MSMVPDNQKKLYVLTGGSGTGKSTVLSLLKERGYPILEEAARKIIAEESAKPDGMSRYDPQFPLFLAKKQIEAEDKLPLKICFLDRSIIDNVAYMERSGKKVPSKLEKMIAKAPYEREVFFLEMPPKNIYGTKGETFEPYEQSLIIHELVEKAYKDRGYKIIKVPFKSYQQQADFIVDYVKKLHWKE